MSNLSDPTIYFESLELKNIKCFKGKQLFKLTNDHDNLPAQWTLILGNNGVGKTTLLQCLAWMSPVPALHTNQKEIIGIIPAINDAENSEIERLLRVSRILKKATLQDTSLKTIFTLNQSFNNSRQNASMYTEINLSGDVRGKLKSSKPSGSLGDYHAPLLITYSANRKQKRGHLGLNFMTLDYSNVFDETTELIDVEAVLTQMDYASKKGNASEKKKSKNLLDTIRKVLAEILPDLKNNPIRIYGPKLPGDTGVSGVRFRTPYGEVPLSELSLGYRTTMGWIVDLAWCLIAKYPDSTTPLSEAAIVLIDEIDLHLHPEWQRNLIKKLSDHFPNVQFIATAHSPLMVQSAKNANLAVLVKEGDHIRIENSPEFLKGWRIDQILTSDLFGIPSARSEEVEKKIIERNRLLKKVDRTLKEQEKLAELDELILDLPTLEAAKDREILDFIKQAAEAIKTVR